MNSSCPAVKLTGFIIPFINPFYINLKDSTFSEKIDQWVFIKKSLRYLLWLLVLMLALGPLLMILILPYNRLMSLMVRSKVVPE